MPLNFAWLQNPVTPASPTTNPKKLAAKKLIQATMQKYKSQKKKHLYSPLDYLGRPSIWHVSNNEIRKETNAMALTPPAYAYIPGHWPHPLKDVQGHSYGHKPATPTTLSLSRWRSCEAYQRGLWLFNSGYYWEAHEEWEAVWRLMGRHTLEGLHLQGLIKVAAAAIKIRQGQSKPARSLLTQAAKHFERVIEKHSDKLAGGLHLGVLERWCRDFRDEVGDIVANPKLEVEVVLPPLKVHAAVE
jgi:hypothetical protein